MNQQKYPMTPRERYESDPRNKGSKPEDWEKCGTGEQDPDTEEYRRMWRLRPHGRWYNPYYPRYYYRRNPFMWPYWSYPELSEAKFSSKE